jgi:hypothetical protein
VTPAPFTSPASRERSRSASDTGEGAAALTRRASRAVFTDAELRALLIDCLTLWDVRARVEAADNVLTITAPDGTYTVHRAAPDMRPARWLLQTPMRAAANRPPRAAPSIVALLAALRNALGAEGGNRLRIGMGAPSS